MAIIGIDLGTTNSLAAVYRDGTVELIPNSLGEYMTPSVVSFGEDGEVFAGNIAKQMLVTKPECTFREFKRNMGTDFEYTAGRRKYRPEELSAFVLRKLKEDAEHYLGEEVTEAVISVPAYFNDDKRCATKNAGKLAGLKVERLINEPSAVALKHHSGSDGMETFLVFDFGGGTLDVSLVEAFENVVEIKAVAGDNYLGGKDFNEAIAAEFLRRNDLALLTPEENGILLKEAEQLKIMLSKEKEARRRFMLRGQEYIMKMTNQELIHCSVELFQRMAKPIQKVINDSGMEESEIDKIILVGGSSKMPVVKQYLKSIISIPVVSDDRPDESIALGVGMAAAIKERTGEVKDMLLADICPFSLGTEVYDGSFSPIIERNDTLPCSRSKYYVTVQDFQKELEFNIYQGENMVAADNLLLGKMMIKNLPLEPKGRAGAMVTFLYDINGILDVRIESKNETVHKVIFNKKMGLSEAEIEKRVEQLKKQTFYPASQEENRLLIERAKSVYQETDPRSREAIANALHQFRGALQFGSNQQIRAQYIQLSVLLAAVEQRQVHFKEFDENFFDDSCLEEE